MQGAERVNDEFEVGFNQTFRIPLVPGGRGRPRRHGPVHASRQPSALWAAGPSAIRRPNPPTAALVVDYEPIARHGTSTTITVHIKKPQDATHPVELSLNQQMIEPMGFQRSIPLANTSSVTDKGMRLSFIQPPDQHDVLVRFQLMPNCPRLHTTSGQRRHRHDQLVHAGGALTCNSFSAPPPPTGSCCSPSA